MCNNKKSMLLTAIVLVGTMTTAHAGSLNGYTMPMLTETAQSKAIITAYSKYCAHITRPLPDEVLKGAIANWVSEDPTFDAQVNAQMSKVAQIAQYPNVLNEWCHKILNQVDPSAITLG
jgi:hypothetical protein